MTEQRTPYALEAHRVALIRRQRLLLLLVIGGLFLLWLTFFQVTTESYTQVALHGEDGTTISVRKPEAPEWPTATISVTPGRTAELASPLQKTDVAQPEQPLQPLVRGRDDPGTPLVGLLLLMSPLLAIRWILKRYGGRVTPLREVNLGVYKGSFPYEMHIAHNKGLVVTGRGTMDNPFGKQYADYLYEAMSG